MSDPYKTSFTSLRTNATSLLGQCMVLDCISPWKSELIQRCTDLLKAITFVEADEERIRIDQEEQKQEQGNE